MFGKGLTLYQTTKILGLLNTKALAEAKLHMAQTMGSGSDTGRKRCGKREIAAFYPTVFSQTFSTKFVYT